MALSEREQANEDADVQSRAWELKHRADGVTPDDRMVNAGYRDEVLTCRTDGCEHFGKDFIPTGFTGWCSSCGNMLVPQDAPKPDWAKFDSMNAYEAAGNMPVELWNSRGGDEAYAAYQGDSGERREMPSMEYIIAHPIAVPDSSMIDISDDGFAF